MNANIYPAETIVLGNGLVTLLIVILVILAIIYFAKRM